MLTINNDRTVFWQWDIGQSLSVEGDVTEVHIGNEGCDKVFVTEPVDGLVAVYDELLQSGKNIIAYEYIKNGEDGHTVKKYKFSVADRPRPTDYVFTPTESMSWEQWVNRAKEYAELSKQYADGIPQTMTEWFNAHREEFKGADGYTPVKGKDYFDGKDGADGKDGSDGKDAEPYDDTEIRGELSELKETLTTTTVLTQSDFSVASGLYIRTNGTIGSDPELAIYYYPCKVSAKYTIETVGGTLRIGTSNKVPAYGGSVSQYDGSGDTIKTIEPNAEAIYLLVYTYNQDYTVTEVQNILDSKVGFTDYATSDKAGVMQGNQNGFMVTASGRPYANNITKSIYDKQSANYFVGKGTLENVLAERLKEPQWELIEAVVLTGDTTLFERSAEPNGTPYNFKAIKFEIAFGGNLELQTYIAININGTTPYSYLSNDTALMRQLASTNVTKSAVLIYGAESKYGEITASCKISVNNKSVNANSVTLTSSTNAFNGDAITRAGLSTYVANGYGLLYAGTVIKIYGVRK